MHAVRLDPEGSVHLPEELRERLGWAAGQEFEAVTRGRVVLLVPVQDLASLRGIARGARTDDYRDKER